MKYILKYFPQLTEVQQRQFAQCLELYPEWNEKINVISRKDIQNLELHHVLHSLAIAKFITFTHETAILDFGTGGGFPAIPLAIMFPEVKFHLVDRIAKKLRVAKDIAEKIGLNNVTLQHGDIKEVKGKYDFVVTRAVMDFEECHNLCQRLIAKVNRNAMPNGIIALKGGEIQNEIKRFSRIAMVEDLSTYFNEEYFKTKKIVYVPVSGK